MRARIIIGFFIAIVACDRTTEFTEVNTPTVTPSDSLMKIPPGFPDVDFPEDNAFTKARWELGKKLFYDPVMSVDFSTSCASCHKQEFAFADDLAFSIGTEGRSGRRNAPSLTNVAYTPYFTREGGVPTLEMQVLVPIQEHDEFNFNMVLLVERLAKDEEYARMSREAYDREPDAFVITRSIATFERSLISGNSLYDRYNFQDKPFALSASQRRGMELFFSNKTNCSECHSGLQFTDHSFQNNGLYEVYADVGRFRLTADSADIELFKVPGLRNVALTAPYMHDGSLETLEDVIEHYNRGGKYNPHKSQFIQPLNLSDEEMTDLVHFLESLTDQTFIENQNLQP